MIKEAQVLEALKGVNDPELGKSLVELGMVHEVQVEDGRVSFTLSRGPGQPEEPLRCDYTKISLSLQDLLARSRDLFQCWRYVFEYNPPKESPYQFHQFEYGLLRCAAEVMRVEIRTRLEGNGKQ